VVHGNKTHNQQPNYDIKTISQKVGGSMNKFKESLITLTILSIIVNVNFNYYAAGGAVNVYHQNRII
jgi:hypothetical protein